MNQGIDASAYDTCPTTNWAQAYARGIRWASIRAATTDGKHLPVADAMHKTNMANAFAANILRMPYGWLDPRVSGATQAQCYLQNRVQGELPDMLDLEDTRWIVAGADILQKIKDWLTIVELDPTTKQELIIYTNLDYIRRHLRGATWLSKYRLFIANYGTPAPMIDLPWSPDWYAWQYTMTGDGTYYGFNVPGFQIRSVALAVMK